jgi:hypothetical protein
MLEARKGWLSVADAADRGDPLCRIDAFRDALWFSSCLKQRVRMYSGAVLETCGSVSSDDMPKAPTCTYLYNAPDGCATQPPQAQRWN